MVRFPLACLVLLLALLPLAGCSSSQATLASAPRTAPPPLPPASVPAVSPEAEAREAVERLLASCAQTGCPLVLPAESRVGTLVVLPGAPPEVEVRLGAEIGALVWRAGEVLAFEARLAEAVHEAIPGATVHAFVEGPAEVRPLASLAIAAPVQPVTLPPGTAPLVRRIDAPHAPEAGLQGRHLALWPSHGWYFEASLDRWEWQRARVFTTVEDLLPFAFVQRHLAPMLERAGANVLLPRERDPQPNQAIVDNDGRSDGRYAERGRWRRAGDGFAHRPPYRGRTNPFTLGTVRSIRAAAETSAEAVWAPEIPASGDYAVYVSYLQGEDNVEDARYTVRHAGGATRFAVNQTMGGGTWVYLGTFSFARGADANSASVTLTNASATPGKTVTADAVRFGGGMGEIERGGSTSGRPRWVEGARYYEQFAGFPDSTVYAVSDENDYKDDYQSRGEWVNYLRGAPYGPTDHRDARGLGIPVDLSLAFHTDAGRTTDGSVIGTLLIYNTKGMDSSGVFPDGRSRRVNRDLAEQAREDIVGDLRANWKTDWTFRDFWNRPYSEATRPNVPSLLLELLSHHNPTDMRYALDPRFRHDASRAIYKSIGRFLAQQDGRRFIPQPLAPTHLVATLEGSSVRVRWMPQIDPLEPLARPDRYVLYQRDGDNGWNGGTLVNGTEVTVAAPEAGEILSVRVAAVNDGGESEWSEALAVGVGREDATPVLIVSGFDRTSGPAWVSEGDWIGFDRNLDEGVADGLDVNTVGNQYEFDTTVPWIDDDQPGHGGSDADLETMVIAGNTRDFVAVHGRAIVASGRSFVSASDEAVMDGMVTLAPYPVVDLVMGEEKTTPAPDSVRGPEFEVWPAPLREALTDYARGGGTIFASGAYLGSDASGDAAAEVFLADVLGVRWRTGHAAVTGEVESASPALLPLGTEFVYNVDNRRDLYRVESPDGLVPASPRGMVALRYSENSISAGIVAPGAITLGFPFEAIPDAETRQRLMAAVLRALERGAGRPGADR